MPADTVVKTTSRRDTAPASEAADKPRHKVDGARDGIEAIVIAFILAFLFRTFEAEAFVIPTGSMAPGLMGQHHDLYCDQCGYRYQVNTSENDDRAASEYYGAMSQMQDERSQALSSGNVARAKSLEIDMARAQEIYANRRTVEGTCPVCRYTMNFANRKEGKYQAFSGDRLIVTKFPYEFGEPKRFDVAVFKYPLGPSENYIKRIVGLPNEDIRIFHGDLFTRPAGSKGAMAIARKPNDKLLSIAQVVHDNDFVVDPDGAPDALLAAGWPARWQGGEWGDFGAGLKFEPGPQGWKSEESGRAFTFSPQDSGTNQDTWLRYQHIVPSTEVWNTFERTKQLPSEAQVPRRPELITDFCAYNTNLDANDVSGRSRLADDKRAVGLGLHWVGDLMLECELDVKQIDGDAAAVTLELVEGSVVDASGERVPCRFQCRIDLKSGEATLSVIGVPDGTWDAKPRVAKTSVRGPGNYELRFSNFDDELRLWVDGSLVTFDEPTSYQFQTADPRDRNNRPTEADLAPVGIQVTGATATVDHLRVKRDIYYIATRGTTGNVLEDYEENELLVVNPSEKTQRETMSDPRYWGQFDKLQEVEFTTGPDDFLPLGDNSPHSADGRLWGADPFVPRRLLIGEAMFIYWPHSWFFPVPNVRDMGFVK